MLTNHSRSRYTVSGENAGKQIAIYSTALKDRDCVPREARLQS